MLHNFKFKSVKFCANILRLMLDSFSYLELFKSLRTETLYLYIFIESLGCPDCLEQEYIQARAT